MVDLQEELVLGGRCLAFHGPLLYQAKILKIWNPEEKTYTVFSNDKNDLGPSTQQHFEMDENDSISSEIIDDECYFIHYQGWKATWDEWVGLDRVRPFNEENIALKNELVENAKNIKKQQEQQKKKKADGTKKRAYHRAGSVIQDEDQQFGSSRKSERNTTRGSSTNSISYNGGDSERGRSSSPVLNYDTLAQSMASKIIIRIPIKLKSVLVDDWEYVTKDKKISRLPPDITVEQLLDRYENEVNTKLELPGEQSQLSEYCAGLKLYFDQALGNMLLYRLERLQYEQLLKESEKEGKTFVPTQIYGPIHLLRLISILVELISNTTMDQQSCQLIVKQSEQLLLWMVMHIDTFFNNKDPNNDETALYVNTSSQYEGVALGI